MHWLREAHKPQSLCVPATVGIVTPSEHPYSVLTAGSSITPQRFRVFQGLPSVLKLCTVLHSEGCRLAIVALCDPLLPGLYNPTTILKSEYWCSRVSLSPHAGVWVIKHFHFPLKNHHCSYCQIMECMASIQIRWTNSCASLCKVVSNLLGLGRQEF